MAAQYVRIEDEQVRRTIEALLQHIPTGILGEVRSLGAFNHGRRYDHYVMDHQHQAWVHKDRWQTDRSIAEKAKVQVRQIYAEAVKQLIDPNDVRAFKKATDEALEVIHKMATTYPPPRANQKYVRTYRLQRSWQKLNQV